MQLELFEIDSIPKKKEEEEEKQYWYVFAVLENGTGMRFCHVKGQGYGWSQERAPHKYKTPGGAARMASQLQFDSPESSISWGMW